MPRTGILRNWNDERGFGFIAPTDGGRELFVHISAFPRDGSRPTVGESLIYELGQCKDGQPQAVRAWRSAIGPPRDSPQAAAAARGERTRRGERGGPPERPGRAGRPIAQPVTVRRAGGGLRLRWAALVALFAVGVYGYGQFAQRPSAVEAPGATIDPTAPATEPAAIRCDGRTHCSQMTSCAEARFFLQNCPGVEMDGDHDGVPCEQQWCTGPLTR